MASNAEGGTSLTAAAAPAQLPFKSLAKPVKLLLKKPCRPASSSTDSSSQRLISDPVFRPSNAVSALNLEAEILFALRHVSGVLRRSKLPTLGPSLADRVAVLVINSVGVYNENSHTVPGKALLHDPSTKRDVASNLHKPARGNKGNIAGGDRSVMASVYVPKKKKVKGLSQRRQRQPKPAVVKQVQQQKAVELPPGRRSPTYAAVAGGNFRRSITPTMPNTFQNAYPRVSSWQVPASVPAMAPFVPHMDAWQSSYRPTSGLVYNYS